MQKAVVVRNAVDDPKGFSYSYEVDAPASGSDRPLGRLLGDGWRVVHTCPMPSELDSCCLVVVEKSPEPKGDVKLAQADVPLEALHHRRDLGRANRHRPQRADWDGESIPLRAFGMER